MRLIFMQLDLALAAISFMFATAYIFIKTLQSIGPTRAFILTLMLADLFIVMLMLLGLDRPWRILYINGRPVWTITYLQLFLVFKLPLTAYITFNREQLKRVLEG